MVEGLEPSVIDAPGVRVWLEMTYWDCAFGVMVSPLMVIGAGAKAGKVGALRGEVVRNLEPAALVVVRIMAGRFGAGFGEGVITMLLDADTGSATAGTATGGAWLI